MNTNWINKTETNRLILFFNGWGMDSSAVKHLETADYNILHCNDYTELTTIEESLLQYSEIYIVAWSLGVWVAAQVINKQNIQAKKAIAINGTLNPIHTTEGIPPEIYQGTLDGWSEKNRRRFLMRIAGGAKPFLAHQDRFGNRTVENQQEELKAIQLQNQTKNDTSISYDLAVIGSEDAIFAEANQWNYWNGKAEIHKVDMPHYPFFHFTSWEQIINS